ncbi:molybdopterin-containing oxidoreductase family iron-sulfur binding subunit [Halorubrum alkaliphilum]|uniref:Molybdopterin-containing oxidoreductase family iron-sulfur binding subunit n=1 Tax=Halorubrum alkaliphilum TaxID=261290 RepID=A0A8T4GHX1_9EURY|nr:4Fe-4S dicluster domain-containing protein [Halorubrum alkaliphilum]MBP1923220.1 molybdopterin-containing oxidoreductase family iron-sulfur binding subunit [Halorubrum alkaliphilum]
MSSESESLDAELETTTLDGEGVDLSMVIDLQRCTGCGACNIGCAQENNLQEGMAYSSRIIETNGEFPNVSYEYTPTLCNQCDDAPCAEGCPTSALHKGKGGITMHDHETCIGCKSCMINCPYDEIHLNEEDPHPTWESEEATIESGTASARAVKDRAGVDDDVDAPAYYNPNREVSETEHPTRYKGIVEKCNFCVHRLERDELPRCVEECPCEARIFGDRNDPDSTVNEVLAKYNPDVLKADEGTEPSVNYVRDYNGGSYERGTGEPGLGD